MQDNTPADHAYTMGYSEEFQQLLRRRSADTHAAYLLSHLSPGMRLLDFGCGPGTISMGLARAVEPGELHGVDVEESQIDMARSAARAGGHANASFHVGDVTALPFEDNYFDAAHCHAVLMHVPDTQGRPGRGEAGPEARWHHRKPRNVRVLLVPGAERRGHGGRMAHLCKASPG